MVLEDYHGQEIREHDICRLREGNAGYVKIHKTREGKFFYVDIEDEWDMYSLDMNNCSNLEIVYSPK
jgi:hypothetical protein